MEKKKTNSKPIARAKSAYTIYNVKESAELMNFLLEKMDGISRSSVKSMLTNRRVLVNNTIRTQYNFELKPGMKVQISKHKNNKEFRSAYLKLIYEDAYMIIVEKQAGLPTIGLKSKKERSAYAILMDYVQRSAKEHRIHLVHKLDKEASGLMIFAKDEKTKNNLQEYWQDIVKELRYVAVLSGEMENLKGVISSWIADGRLYTSTIDPKRDKEDKAITYYTIIKKRNGYSLVELIPENGMKSQLRLHMQELHHPIIGDDRFGNGDDPLKRLALHAFKLEMRHPVTGERISFDIPYPPAFKNILIKRTETESEQED